MIAQPHMRLTLTRRQIKALVCALDICLDMDQDATHDSLVSFPIETELFEMGIQRVVTGTHMITRLKADFVALQTKTYETTFTVAETQHLQYVLEVSSIMWIDQTIDFINESDDFTVNGLTYREFLPTLVALIELTTTVQHKTSVPFTIAQG